MPARYVVQILDDMDYPERETPADLTVQLTLTVANGTGPPRVRKAALYLTEEHGAELEKDLDRWFDLTGKASGRVGTTDRGKYRDAQRQFVDLFGIRCRKNPGFPAYMTSTGKNGYYPPWLDKEFDAWIEAGSPPPGKYQVKAG